MPQNLFLERPARKCPPIAMNIEQVRFNMVEQQIRTWDVLDTDVLDLLHTLKRENFVPSAQREFALMDIRRPAGAGIGPASAWTPKMEARVVRDLDLKGHEHVLEVGTGSGYSLPCWQRAPPASPVSRLIRVCQVWRRQSCPGRGYQRGGNYG